MRNFARLVIQLLLVGFGLLSLGCGKKEEPPSPDRLPVFRILAGSELKDMEPLLTAFGAREGVTFAITYSGSLNAIDTLATKNSYDAVWLADDRYLRLQPTLAQILAASTKTMYSSVVLGVQQETVKQLGWESGTTWDQVRVAMRSGKLRLAMTSPLTSNTGFSTLIGLAANFSGKGDALTAADVPVSQLKEFYQGVTMTSSSSSALLAKVIASPTLVNSMINYDSLVAQVPGMVPVQINDGVITASYPLSLLKQSQQAPVYTKLVTYLKSPEAQAAISAQTKRRTQPIASSAPELPFPGNVATVDALLQAFQETLTRPTASIFVVDVSGSMNGSRLEELQGAFQGLIRADAGLSSRFAAFHPNETIVIIPFSDTPGTATVFEMPQATEARASTLQRLNQTVVQLQAGGSTAIYSSILEAQKLAKDFESKKITPSIILMTDGVNNRGESLESALAILNSEKKAHAIAPVYPIVYGEADAKELQALASATGGTLYSAERTPLRKVFAMIRTGQ